MPQGIDNDHRPREVHQQEWDLLPHQCPPAQPAEPTKRVDIEEEEGRRQRKRHTLREQRGGEREGRDHHRPPLRRPVGLDAPEVGPDRHEREQGAEQIGPAGDPADRLDAEWMDPEDQGGDRGPGSDRGLAPRVLGSIVHRGREQAPRHEVEDRRVRRVNQHVHQVIAPRVKAPQRVVQAPRETGQGDVVAEQDAGEGPVDLLTS